LNKPAIPGPLLYWRNIWPFFTVAFDSSWVEIPDPWATGSVLSSARPAYGRNHPERPVLFIQPGLEWGTRLSL